MARNDEETPLLTKVHPTPLPRLQFSILLFLQLAEPLTSNVINPFAPQLIRDLGITHGKDSRVGYYVGLLVWVLLSWFEFHLWKVLYSVLYVLRCRRMYSSLLESNVRSRWEKASYNGRTSWALFINVFLWTFENVCGIGNKVHFISMIFQRLVRWHATCIFLVEA